MRRRKSLFAVLALLLLTRWAGAGISIQWGFSWGMYAPGANDLTADTGGVAAANDVLWQLIYSPDQSADINLSTGQPINGDVLLASRITLAGGSDGYDAFLYDGGTYGTPFESSAYNSGYAYIRVFQDADYAVYERFYDSPVVAVLNINLSDPMRIPQVLEGNSNPALGGDRPNISLILPEPSSIALAAGGVLLLALRRWAGRA